MKKKFSLFPKAFINFVYQILLLKIAKIRATFGSKNCGFEDMTPSEFWGQALMTYLLHVDERLSQVVMENVGVSLFVALHGTDGHDYAVFVDAIATPVPVKLEKNNKS